jgi:hypothetical protein
MHLPLFLLSLGLLMTTSSGLLLTDFTSNTSDMGWYVVNDNVMGGRSEGDFIQEQEKLSFAGRTNTNGGGFSSIRTEPLQLDLSNFAGIQWADFETLNGTWTTVNIPFADFIPQFRGYQLEGPELDPTKINGMGLMIYDNQDGPFELELASVHAY